MKIYFLIIVLIESSFAFPPYTYKSDLKDVAKTFREMLETDVDVAKSVIDLLPEDDLYKMKLQQFVDDYENPDRNSCVSTTFPMISKFRSSVPMGYEELTELSEEKDLKGLTAEQHAYLSAFMSDIDEIQKLVNEEHGDVHNFMSVIC